MPIRKSRQIPNTQEIEDIQQPLGKDGFSNPEFDRLYGKKNNPETGSERDNVNKLGSRRVTIPGKGWRRIFGRR